MPQSGIEVVAERVVVKNDSGNCHHNLVKPKTQKEPVYQQPNKNGITSSGKYHPSPTIEKTTGCNNGFELNNVRVELNNTLNLTIAKGTLTSITQSQSSDTSSSSSTSNPDSNSESLENLTASNIEPSNEQDAEGGSTCSSLEASEEENSFLQEHGLDELLGQTVGPEVCEVQDYDYDQYTGCFHQKTVSISPSSTSSNLSIYNNDLIFGGYTKRMERPKKVYKVVLTGGPCGGKTTGQARLCTFFENLGWKVYRVPEAANLLLGGGIKFSDLSPEQAFSFQEGLLKVMIELESVFSSVAELDKQDVLIICDRGAMDASAFIPKSEWQEILDRNQYNEVDLRDARYHQIIHMVSSANGAEPFYTCEGHETRSEGLEMARELDRKAAQAWVGHPYFDVVDNSTDFETKVCRMIQCVCQKLGIDARDRLQTNARKVKYLVKGPLPEDSLFPPGYQDFAVVHHYLQAIGPEIVQARLRKRGQQGHWSYTYTVRRQVQGQVVEVRTAISHRDYCNKLSLRHPEHNTVFKLRRCFLLNNQYFQLDVYREPCHSRCVGIMLLETYSTLSSDELKQRLPAFLHIVKEVTGNPMYFMCNLSLKKTWENNENFCQSVTDSEHEHNTEDRQDLCKIANENSLAEQSRRRENDGNYSDSEVTNRSGAKKNSIYDQPEKIIKTIGKSCDIIIKTKGRNSCIDLNNALNLKATTGTIIPLTQTKPNIPCSSNSSNYNSNTASCEDLTITKSEIMLSEKFRSGEGYKKKGSSSIENSDDEFLIARQEHDFEESMRSASSSEVQDYDYDDHTGCFHEKTISISPTSTGPSLSFYSKELFQRDQNSTVETNKIYKVVLTGGPCGGKTTGQARLCTFFENLGWKVYRVPEAANILLSGGIKFSDLSAEQAFMFQEKLLLTMGSLETVFSSVAELDRKNVLIICDRGAMDASAFIPKSQWADILERNKFNEVDLRDARYHQIIHMVSSANGAEAFYTCEGHETRSEGLELARELDRKAAQAWVGHPYFDVVDNSTDFETKVCRMIQCVCQKLGIDARDRLQTNARKVKYLVKGPMPEDGLFPPGFQDFVVVHDYLEKIEKEVIHARLRKRGQKGHWSYTYTVRREVQGQVVEVRTPINHREYCNMLTQRDIKRKTVFKHRRCFLVNDQYFQLDVYIRPSHERSVGVMLLETYSTLSSEELKQRLPEFLDIVKDVTGDPEYFMCNLCLREKWDKSKHFFYSATEKRDDCMDNKDEMDEDALSNNLNEIRLDGQLKHSKVELDSNARKTVS